MNDEYKEYANEHGILSAYAYKHLSLTHSHPLGDDGEDMVTFNDALKAIKIAEKDLIDEQDRELKAIKKEESWFMKIINHIFCNHEWDKLHTQIVTKGNGNNKIKIKEIILYQCKKCGKLYKYVINAKTDN